jgi:hyperosmotically inducible protein
MMTNKKLTALATGAVLLICSSAVVFADSDANNMVGDSVITTKIKAKMAADKEVSSLSVGVETNNGVVTLSGSVPTDREASKAVEIAESTDGVKNVDAANLTVQKSGQPVTDAVITAKVKGTFVREKVFGDAPISVTGIKVETKDGVVYLAGHATRAQAGNAERLAKNIDGVTKVVSRIKESK